MGEGSISGAVDRPGDIPPESPLEARRRFRWDVLVATVAARDSALGHALHEANGMFDGERWLIRFQRPSSYRRFMELYTERPEIVWGAMSRAWGLEAVFGVKAELEDLGWRKASAPGGFSRIPRRAPAARAG